MAVVTLHLMDGRHICQEGPRAQHCLPGHRPVLCVPQIGADHQAGRALPERCPLRPEGLEASGGLLEDRPPRWLLQKPETEGHSNNEDEDLSANNSSHETKGNTNQTLNFEI